MRRSLSAALPLFFVVLAFYAYTLSPALPWGDAARMQLEVATGSSTYLLLEDIEDAIPATTDNLPFARLGVAAWDHPFYVMLGRLFLAMPGGDNPVRLNWMSAIAGAIAAVLTFETGRFLSGDWRAALLGALALAVSHTFWWHSVNAEVYTLHVAIMMSLILITLHWMRNPNQKHLLLYSLLAGLGLANHLLMGITLIVTLLWVIRIPTPNGAIRSLRDHLRTRRLHTVACIALFIIGFAPWWIQFIRLSRLIDTTLILKAIIGYPGIGTALQISSLAMFIENILTYGAWLLYQFTPVGILLGVYGILRMRRDHPRETGFILVLFIAHATFSANFAALDQFTLHLLSYPCFALFIIEGIAAFLKDTQARSLLLSTWKRFGLHTGLMAGLVALPVTLYTLTPFILRAAGITEAKLDMIPIGVHTRDIFAVYLNPNRRDDFSAAQFGRGTLNSLAPNALVLTPNNVDGEAYIVLRYFQLVEHMRPDVHLELMLFHSPEMIPEGILDLIRSQKACHPLYLVSLNPTAYPLDQIQAEFQIAEEANIYRLVPQDQPDPLPCPDVAFEQQSLPLQQRLERAMQGR